MICSRDYHVLVALHVSTVEAPSSHLVMSVDNKALRVSSEQTRIKIYDVVFRLGWNN